ANVADGTARALTVSASSSIATIPRAERAGAEYIRFMRWVPPVERSSQLYATASTSVNVKPCARGPQVPELTRFAAARTIRLRWPGVRRPRQGSDRRSQ